MKLQNKLIIAFSIMLVLVACTAASGWFAMRDMGRMAVQIAHINGSLFNIESAQINQLRYVAYKETKYVPIVEEHTSKAKQQLQQALPYILVPAQKTRAEKAFAAMDAFQGSFTELAGYMKQGESLAADMITLNAEFSQLSEKSLDMIEQNLLENYDETTFKSFYLLTKADSSFHHTRTLTRTYMGQVTAENAQNIHKNLAVTRTFFNQADALMSRPENKAMVKQLLAALDKYENNLRGYIDVQTTLNEQLLKVRSQASTVVTLCDEMSTAAQALMTSSQSSGNTTNMLTLLAAIIVGIGITLFLTKNVMQQLGKDPGELASIATRVTSGDYSIDDGSPRLGVYNNIVGMVAALKTNIENANKATAQAEQESTRAMEAMKNADIASKDAQARRDSILIAADKLEEVAHVVSSASEELSAQIEQSERGAAEQAARVGETATAMEQMNSTVLEVARNAADAHNGGKSMRDKAFAGAQIVDSSVAGVQKARTDALALKEDMNALSDQAQSIGQIMNVISDIADQTNLLALNAAIEAARAGEAGRGFAVVADEVRKLAEKTMQSTTDVGTAIKTIQASAAKNMAQVDATVKNIEISTGQAEKSGQALREIVEMIDVAVEQVSSIATASEEQSATSEEINRSVAEVSTIAAETARAMQEAAQAVSDLSHQAQVLTRLIDDMKKG